MRNRRLSVEKATCFSTRCRGKSVSRTTPCEGLQMWIPRWWTTAAAVTGERQPMLAVNSEFLGQVPDITLAPERLPCSLFSPLYGGELQHEWRRCGHAASRFQGVSGVLGMGEGFSFYEMWGLFRKISHSTLAKPFKVWRKIAGLQMTTKRGCSIRCMAAIWNSGSASPRPVTGPCMLCIPQKACWYQKSIEVNISLLWTMISWYVCSAQPDFRLQKARSCCLFLCIEKKQMDLWRRFYRWKGWGHTDVLDGHNLVRSISQS